MRRLKVLLRDDPDEMYFRDINNFIRRGGEKLRIRIRVQCGQS